MSSQRKIPDYSVVTCFIEYNERVLILKRAKQDSQYGLWGVPGGKLEKGEAPIAGLCRELKEELSFEINPNEIISLASTPMQNKCDGHYLLYLYCVKLHRAPVIKLNSIEHSECAWVSISKFKDYPLLFCQGAAFDLIKDKLKNELNKTKEGTYV